MPLVHNDLTFDRSAIMAFAWAEYRGFLNRPGTPHRRSFGACLSYAWRTARFARQRVADGLVERERQEAAAREVLRRQRMIGNMTNVTGASHG